METLKLLKNKIRIWLLSKFTNRIKHIKITDKKGRDHNVTFEQKKEEVCDHSKLEQVDPITWACIKKSDCDMFFIITSKLMANTSEILEHQSKIKGYMLEHNYIENGEKLAQSEVTQEQQKGDQSRSQGTQDKKEQGKVEEKPKGNTIQKEERKI